MESLPRSRVVTVVVAACLVSVAIAETKKEFRYTVSPDCNVSVDTQYGSISVRPGTTNEVVVKATLQSDLAEVDNQQSGNRIQIFSHLFQGSDQQTGRIDYELLVPPSATLSLRSSTGPLAVERLRGDLSLEGTDAVVDIHDVSNAHVHVNTMRGPITLTEVHDGHIELSSISGDITMKSVTGPLVKANSGSGKISYDGDFSSGGDYKFTTHTGDITAIVPASTSADFSAHSMLGKVRHDFPLQPRHTPLSFEEGRAFFGTVGKAGSAVVLRSFSGRIRLKQR
ncbi:MAG: DUF4097 family beta strand repeat-containing protein [Terriglobales bacterium]|jgi:DUF4097 and DUF4098 domain-containing protein YvlB